MAVTGLIFLGGLQSVPAQEAKSAATSRALVPASEPVVSVDPAVVALERTLPEARFDGIPFSDVVTSLRAVSGTNIIMNERALDVAGIDKTARISVHLRNVKFGKALQIVLDAATGKLGILSYAADEGVITISTVEDLKKTRAMVPRTEWMGLTPQQDDRNIADAIERKIPELRFDAIPLSDAVDFLRGIDNANIFVNWKALESAGVTRDAPVTARLRDVTLERAIRTILRDVGGGAVRLDFSVDEGVITISTMEDLESTAVTHVFDINDVIAVVDPGQPQIYKDFIEQLIRLICDTIARDSWKANGGTIGTIREADGELIVMQLPDNQRLLARLLRQLRETRPNRIVTEATLLDLPQGRVKTLGAFDPAIGWMTVDQSQMGSLTGGDIRRLAAPPVTTLHGQPIHISDSANDMSLNLGLLSTFTRDGKSLRIVGTFADLPSALPVAGEGRKAVQKRAIVTVPDGGIVLLKLTDPSPGRERWLAIKSSILILQVRGERLPPAQP